MIKCVRSQPVKLKKILNGLSFKGSEKRMAYPKTIDELRMWAEDNNLPLDDMRTYIGTDYRGAKAYGIYEDKETGKFIVYKNKADGTRSVRYEGYDQAYAVNELYMKMQERIEQQNQGNSYQRYAPTQDTPDYKTISRHIMVGCVFATMAVIIIVCLVFFVMLRRMQGPSSGYYLYNDTYYYCQGDDFYYYDYYNDAWYYADYVDNELIDNYTDYYESSGYYDSYDIMDFQDSGYYDWNYYDNDDDWDNDWDDDWDDDWGNDWNDGYDDWDSDW